MNCVMWMEWCEIGEIWYELDIYEICVECVNDCVDVVGF